jgi:hypothetical protein
LGRPGKEEQTYNDAKQHPKKTSLNPALEPALKTTLIHRFIIELSFNTGSSGKPRNLSF